MKPVKWEQRQVWAPVKWDATGFVWDWIPMRWYHPVHWFLKKRKAPWR